MGKKRSWVWEYAKRKGDKAYCELCDEDENNEYSCVGGTTGSLIRHLKIMYKVYQPESSTSSKRYAHYKLMNTHLCLLFAVHFLFLFFCNYRKNN